MSQLSHPQEYVPSQVLAECVVSEVVQCRAGRVCDTRHLTSAGFHFASGRYDSGTRISARFVLKLVTRHASYFSRNGWQAAWRFLWKSGAYTKQTTASSQRNHTRIEWKSTLTSKITSARIAHTHKSADSDLTAARSSTIKLDSKRAARYGPHERYMIT